MDPDDFAICDSYEGKCVLRISKLDIYGIAIFGDVFMQEFYSIFDIGK